MPAETDPSVTTKYRTTFNRLESLLVRHVQSRGYRIVVSPRTGDRVCWLDGKREGPKLNLTELAKDLIKDLET